MEHARHFSTSMEMCMDDHLTLTTEKIQQKQFQGKTSEQSCSTHSISPHPQKNTVRSHVEFPPSIESMQIFLGNQFLQGKEKSTLKTKPKPFVDTGTFTLGMINFLNRYSALSTLTHQAIDYKPGRVHLENFQRLKMKISNMKALPYCNINAETTLQTDAPKKGSGASLIQKGKDIPVTDTFSQVTPMNPEDDIQLPIRKANMITTCILTCIPTRILMSIQSQDSLSNKLDRLKKSTAQGNQLTGLSRYTSTGFLCDKKDLPTDLHESWNDRETLSTKFRMNITLSIIRMITTQCLMSEHSSDSISNRLAQPEKNTLQKKYITRLKGHNNIDQLCDRENLPTDLPPESWSHKEPLYNRCGLINHGVKIIPVIYIHKELYILPRPSKAMAQWKFQYMQKEVYILSRPSKLQPMTDYSIAPQHTPREKDLPPPLSMLEAQQIYRCTHKELCFLPEPLEKKVNPYRFTKEPKLAKQTLVQHRQNTSWEPATVVSQCNSNSYWIMQENGTDQPKVYRRTRTMLKIRCTDVRQTRHNYSQSTESEKSKFQTPAIPNATRNCVEQNSAENVSQDLVQLTKSDTEASASFDSVSEEREEIAEIADVPAPTPAPALERVEEQSHTPGSRKSTRKNFGRPASSFSDFYM